MIEITNLTKTYPGPVHALQGLTLTIGSGVFGLLGPNGAGKTSLMRILAGLIRPSAGTARLFGHDVADEAGRQAIKAGLGYLPQELGLYPNLTAFEFLDYMAMLKGITDPAARRQQVGAVLDQVRLTEAAGRRLKTYSGGMKRRVGIAQALLGDPQLVIVDEPTVGLDPEERVRLRGLLTDLAGQPTVILSTHIIEDISQSCQALAVIERGRLRFAGSPTELIKQARGHVWQIETAGERPAADVTIVLGMAMAQGIRYRVLGDLGPERGAILLEPTLEDGYMWLMRDQGKAEA